MEKCEILFDAKKYLEAIECCQGYLLRFPLNAQAWFLLGNSYLSLNFYERAIKAFDRVILFDPEYASPYNNKGIALLYLGRQLKERNIFEESIKIFDKAIKIDSHDAERYSNKALCLYCIGEEWKERDKLEDAIELYNKAITIDPNYASSFNNKCLALTVLGRDWKERGKLEDAIDLCNKAIERNFENAKWYYNKGSALYYIGREWKERDKLDECIKACNKSLELDPAYLDSCNSKGLALYYISTVWDENDKCEEAIKAFDRTIELDPEFADAYNSKGLALNFLGDQYKDLTLCEKAILSYNLAIELDPLFVSAYSNKGRALIQIGEKRIERAKLEEAVKVSVKAIELDPKYASAYNNKGLALTHIGHFWKERDKLEQAIEEFNIAIRLNPESTPAYDNIAMPLYYIGLLWREREKIESAIKASNEAIELNPRSALAYHTKGLALSRIGQEWKERGKIEEAIIVYNIVASIDPKNTASFNNKGLALYFLGCNWKEKIKLEEAINTYDIAINIDPQSFSSYYNKGIALFFLGVNWREREKLEMAYNAFDRATTLEPESASAYYDKATTLYHIHLLWGRGNLYEVFRNFNRAFYLNQESILDPYLFINFLLTFFNSPHLVNRFLAVNPFLKTDSKNLANLEIIEKVYQNHRNQLIQVKKELRINHLGNDFKKRFYLYRAIAEYMGGDPIIAFEIHDSIVDSLWDENLQHHYYYILSAIEIIHPDADKTLSYGVKKATDYITSIKQEAVQLYYAACIFILNGNYDKGIDILQKVISEFDYLPGWFKLLECYDLMQDLVKQKEITDSIYQRGLLNYFKTQIQKEQLACIELHHDIERMESWTGWYLAETLINVHDQVIYEKGIPLTRSKYYTTENNNKQSLWPNPSQHEINELDPERLNILIDACRNRMENLFQVYEKVEKLDGEKVAENMLAHMMNEKKFTGKVLYNDYLDLLIYCFSTSKIDQIDYIIISTYLNLKCQFFNKGKNTIPTIIATVVLKEVVGALVDALGGCLPGIPIKQLLLLIFNNSDEETIRSMNFQYFKMHYNALSNYSSNQIAEALKGNEWLDSVKDSLQN